MRRRRGGSSGLGARDSRSLGPVLLQEIDCGFYSFAIAYRRMEVFLHVLHECVYSSVCSYVYMHAQDCVQVPFKFDEVATQALTPGQRVFPKWLHMLIRFPLQSNL